MEFASVRSPPHTMIFFAPLSTNSRCVLSSLAGGFSQTSSYGGTNAAPSGTAARPESTIRLGATVMRVWQCARSHTANPRANSGMIPNRQSPPTWLKRPARPSPRAFPAHDHPAAANKTESPAAPALPSPPSARSAAPRTSSSSTRTEVHQKAKRTQEEPAESFSLLPIPPLCPLWLNAFSG